MIVHVLGLHQLSFRCKPLMIYAVMILTLVFLLFHVPLLPPSIAQTFTAPIAHAQSPAAHQQQQAVPLIVTKRTVQTEILPGDTIEYVITVENQGEDWNDIALIEHLPDLGRFVPDSLIWENSAYTPTYESALQQIKWNAIIPAMSQSELRYHLKSWDRVDCDAIVASQLWIRDPIDETQSILAAPVQVHCETPILLTDFGDAPDSDSNHHGLTNVAYGDDGTLGRFPTVWEGTPPGEPSGPTHKVGLITLGGQSDGEQYADVYWDSPNLAVGENQTNILQNGNQDVADKDGDDGWLGNELLLANCEPSSILIALTRADVPLTVDQIWLNIWFDGNRDGDWQDTGTCPVTSTDNDTIAYEWIVQNHAISVAEIPLDRPLFFYAPTVAVHNQAPDRDVWLRMTVSEQPALASPAGGQPDGRGPTHPAYFTLGETEDWYLGGIPTGESTEFIVAHYVDDNTPLTKTVGAMVTFWHTIALPETAIPALATLTVTLPSEVTLATAPTLFPERDQLDYFSPTLIEQLSPFAPTFQPDIGPSGTIAWHGQMAGGSSAVFFYTVRIDRCPVRDIATQPQLELTMLFQQAEGSIQSEQLTVPIECDQIVNAIRHLYLPLIAR